ncbi:GDSL-type esterase/lipase family protein [Streptomyces sp. x-80]|uniref:GDSL-type esterase/lipase family protein n=1 Tax=Streptomyces sp. x-80 TaxID=2789282 RepID=UPI0039803004
MGDSFISGEGGRWRGNGVPVAPAGDRYGTDRAAYNCWESWSWCNHDAARVYADSYKNGCNRSDSAEVSSTSIPARPVNLACSGAGSDNIFRTSHGGQPFKGEAPQADQLAHLDGKIKLIVLSIGGNDLGFSGIITSCVMNYTFSKHCKDEQDPTIAQGITDAKPKVAKAIDEIRAVMQNKGYQDDDYRLILQSYPSPIPRGSDNRYPQTYERHHSGGCPLYNDDSTWARDSVVPRISAMLYTAATEKHVQFLDLQNALNGHEVCAKTARQATNHNSFSTPQPPESAEWIRFLVALGSQGDQQESIHPNYFGQKALGQCLTLLHHRPKGDFACHNTPDTDASGMHLEPLRGQ